MKTLAATALVCLIAFAGPARAAPVDMGAATCQDWFDASEDEQDQMLAWLRGYLAGRSTSTLYEVSSLRADRATLRGFCQGHLTSGLISAASEWKH